MSDKSKTPGAWKIGIAVILTAAGLIGAIVGLKNWVEQTAQQAVLDENFLSTLAKRVRPACVFNSNGAIEADFGASDYIQDIRVIPKPKEFGYVITIKAKRFLYYPPLITGLDVDLLPQSETRGKMYDWEIEVAPNSTVSGIIAEGGMDTNAVHRFKMEILH